VAVFDEYIGKVAEYTEAMRAGGSPVQEFDCAGSSEDLRAGLPVKVGPGANPGIILRSDTFMELGNPAAGSCSLLLWTDDPARIRDGRITLFGPGIQESAGASLPFGQVLIAAGEDLDAEDQEALQQAQHVSDQIEGYMVRTASENVWGRVSADAGARGFDFETLGRALMSLVKAEVPGVSAMEMVFVTTSREDVKRLDEIASKVGQISGEILRETWKARGYDMDCDFDCESCVDQAVCDEIRDVIAANRKKNRKKARAEGSDAGS
jgi:CO dehydrogenase/acetyl-CoA synthase beta subunit